MWPSWKFVELTPIILQQVESEARKLRPLIEVSNLVSEKKEGLLLGMDDTRFSSLRKLLRITVYVLRFIKLKIWNRLDTERRKPIQQDQLLLTIFDELKEGEPITAKEIKLSGLLWL